MAGPVTLNFGIQLPEVNADSNVWGTILNSALGSAGGIAAPTSFDAELKRVDDVAAAAVVTADAALPVAGGVMTGRIEEHSATLKTVDLGVADGAVPMNLALANFFLAQPTTGGGALSTQYVFAGVPAIADVASIVFLQVLAGGSGLVSWDAAIIWPSAIIPALSSLGTDLVGFYTPDQGTTWYGSLVQRDVR